MLYKGGSNNYGNMCWADGIFPPRKKSLPLHFFTRKKSLPRHFFLQKKCLPRHFSGQKKSLPLHLNWVKSTLQIIQKGYYDYVQWWVVVNWTISKHMTHSASSVRQESINNKKAVNVISAKKVSAPSFFSSKKALAPSFFSSKKVYAPSFFFAKKVLAPPSSCPAYIPIIFAPSLRALEWFTYVKVTIWLVVWFLASL